MQATYTLGFILGTLILGATISSFYPQANPNPLAGYKWQKRILLVFMPYPDHQAGAAQLNLLKQVSQELEARDLEVLVIAGDNIENVKLKPNAGTILRQQFDIAPPVFALVLIGKDGGLKYQSNKVENPGTIFNIIDAMPMRQNEVKQQQNKNKSN